MQAHLNGTGKLPSKASFVRTHLSKLSNREIAELPEAKALDVTAKYASVIRAQSRRWDTRWRRRQQAAAKPKQAAAKPKQAAARTKQAAARTTKRVPLEFLAREEQLKAIAAAIGVPRAI